MSSNYLLLGMAVVRLRDIGVTQAPASSDHPTIVAVGTLRSGIGATVLIFAIFENVLYIASAVVLPDRVPDGWHVIDWNRWYVKARRVTETPFPFPPLDSGSNVFGLTS